MPKSTPINQLREDSNLVQDILQEIEKNSPSTQNNAMNQIYPYKFYPYRQDYNLHYPYVYLDDIFLISCSCYQQRRMSTCVFLPHSQTRRLQLQCNHLKNPGI